MRPAYEFDDVRVESDEFRVLKAGQPVALEPKAIDVLTYLVENSGRLVGKQELLDAVWKDTAVSEGAMTRVIAQLRKALGDAATEPRYLETVPTRGYRFIGAVRRAPEAERVPTVVVRFGTFELDRSTGELRRAGQRVPLQDQPAQVLSILVSRPGAVVTRDELRRALWSDDTFVEFDTALNVAVNKIRQALGDSATSPRFVETVPKRGYRFLAEVHPVEPRAAAETPEPRAPETSGAPHGSNLGIVAAAAAAVVVAVIGLAWWVAAPRSERSTSDEPVARLTQVTTTSGLDLYPVFSPDGAHIAYSSDRSGRFEIWLLPLTSGAREIQVTSDGADNLQPGWSPDGRQLAYHSRERGGIWVVPALGGVSRRLTDFGSTPAWSPDGSTIVFQSGVQADLGASNWGTMPPSTLWLVPAAGGPARPLTKPGGPAGGHGSAAWSPDGTRLVFGTYDSNLSQVWSVSPTGDRLVKLLPTEEAWPPLFYYDPVFSPDGRFLYTSASPGAWLGFTLWRLRVPQTGAAWGAPEPLPSAFSGAVKHLSVSPDGRTLAFIQAAMRSNLASVPVSASSGDATGPPRLLTNASGSRNTTPAWSPDGERLVFASGRAGAGLDLYLADADGAHARLLVSGASNPSWFPEGSRVAFQARSRGRSGVRSVDVASGKEQPLPLPADESLSWPRVSPDGSRVAYHLRQGSTLNVWTAPLSGGEPQQVTADAEKIGWPCWSPDGRLLAVEIGRGEDTHVGVVSSGGGPVRQLTSAKGQTWLYSFSPDGRRVAFAGERDGLWGVYWVDVRDGAVRRVTSYDRRNVYVRYPAWSPRGDRIVFEHAETVGNVWTMTLPD